MALAHAILADSSATAGTIVAGVSGVALVALLILEFSDVWEPGEPTLFMMVLLVFLGGLLFAVAGK